MGAKLLDDDSWNKLQEISERFERESGEFPRQIVDYLPDFTDPIRPLVLDELVRIDMELLWKNGKGRGIEEYVREFPELSQDKRKLASLVEEEFRVRERFGGHPEIEEYEKRFPDLAAELATKLRPGKTPGEFETLESSIEIPFATSGNLKKIRRIGEGGFGEVWECLAPGGVHVAVKRIFATVSPKFIDREKKSLDLICSGNFRHPFLLQVFGWWVQNDQLHIVMELADESLDDRLRAAKAKGAFGLPSDSLRKVMRDAGDALDFLNFERHILHRDVKPANMLLMGGRLKLCDFGLARMTANLGVSTGKTLGAGTPVFIAPEIIKGYQSTQSDQYSLAASYCMLRSGRPLFRGTVNEIRNQHVSAAPKFADDVFTAGEREVLLKALAKEPGERYPTSSAFVDELLATVGGRSSGGRVLVADTPTQPMTNSFEAQQATVPNQPLHTASGGWTPVKRTRPMKIGADSDPTLIHQSTQGSRFPWWLVLLAFLAIFIAGLAIGSALLNH